MPRTNKVTVALEPQFLLSHREVKTITYSKKAIKLIKESGAPIEEKDIRGWCNLKFTVVRLSPCKKLVTLNYNVRNGVHTNITVPITMLSKSYKIKI
jgi:hypothetical protein